jgi:hypothetical protein
MRPRAGLWWEKEEGSNPGEKADSSAGAAPERPRQENEEEEEEEEASKGLRGTAGGDWVALGIVPVSERPPRPREAEGEEEGAGQAHLRRGAAGELACTAISAERGQEKARVHGERRLARDRGAPEVEWG